MLLPERIRKIREHRGYKQAAVAQEMHITQQAYSCLETKAGNLKMETMQRFCDVMKVEIAFLLAFDVPVNDENLKMFDQMAFAQMLDEYKRLNNKLSVYEDLLRRDTLSRGEAK